MVAKTKEKEKAKDEVREQEQVAANVPATVAGGAVVAGIDYAADAGVGLEGADADSYAIPFLLCLQPLSPQVDAVPNAKAGMFLNSVTNELFANDGTLRFIPCAFQRRWIRWTPRDAGGGFKGEFQTAAVNDLRTKGLISELDGRFYFPLNGAVDPKKCDRLADTRSHFGLLLRNESDEIPIQLVFALASTSIKVSKNLVSRIDAARLIVGGKPMKVASFAHMYSLKSTLKTNEKGKWWQPEFDNAGPVKSQAVYAMAKAFHALVSSGKVDVAHDSVRGNADDAAAAGSGDDDRV